MQIISLFHVTIFLMWHNLKQIKLVSFFLLMLFSLIMLLRSDNSFDQDLGRHLKLGEIIMQTGFVPHNNLFSYTNPDFNFINHHYLFEILAYLGSISIGIEGLLIIKTLIILITIYLILRLCFKDYSLLTFPIAFLFLHLMRERIDLRPEIFSFLFTALSLVILEKYEPTKTKLIWFLPLIQLIWVNTHIYFVIGFAIQAIYIIYYLFNHSYPKFKTLLIILITSILLSLLNPNFISGLIYPLRVFDNYGYTIAENQSIFLLESLNFKNPNFLFVKLATILIVGFCIYSLSKKKLNLKDSFLILSGLILAYINIRSIPYLFLLSIVPLVKILPKLKLNYLTFGLNLLTASILIYESIMYLNSNYYLYSDSSYQFGLESEEHSKSALDFVLKNTLPQPIFNNFDIGSYIIYRAYPEYKVFIDGRPEAYPKEFIQQIYIPAQENPDNFKIIDQRIGFKTIIFSHTDQTPWAKSFLKFITKNPDWQIVFLDDFMIVLVKTDVLKGKQLFAINLNTLKPEQYSFDNYLSYTRMSLFLFSSGYQKQALEFAKKALNIFPESSINNTLMFNILSQSQNPYDILTANAHQLKSEKKIWW